MNNLLVILIVPIDACQMFYLDFLIVVVTSLGFVLVHADFDFDFESFFGHIDRDHHDFGHVLHGDLDTDKFSLTQKSVT